MFDNYNRLKNTKVMTCQKCKGKGWVMNKWSPTGYPLKKCSSCSGTGIKANN